MLIVENRRARFEYFIIESFEAGIQLTGSEIKSIRAGQVSIEEAYVKPTSQGSELVLVGAHIKQYAHSAELEYNPVRERKLLLSRREISQMVKAIQREGLTIVPLDIHLKNGRAKVQIVLAKGKKLGDKRNTTKEREAKREIARGMSKGY